MRKNFLHLQKEAGFTLIELMVVIVILGALVAIMAPKIMGRADDAKVTEARVQIRNFETALKLYKLDTGRYPTTEHGLIALIEKPTISPVPRKWRKGGYLEKKSIPKDPWQGRYKYLSPGLRGDFDIITYGADNERGGEDYDKDLTNHDVEE